MSDERNLWLTRTREEERRTYPRMKLSTQGLLLFMDIERAYVAGAWLSVVVLSYAVVDATLRDIVTGDYKRAAREIYGANADLDWLRTLRNDIIHVSAAGTPSTLWKRPPSDLAACHAALEDDAQRAVRLAYRQVYAQAGV
jgi:hypothetical protein